MTLEHRHQVSGPVQLIGTGQAGRSRTHHRHAAAGPRRRRFRHDPALGETPVDNRLLDVLDRHRRIGDPQHAGTLARRRTDPTCEFREIVRLVQAVQSITPAVVVDQVVPFRDQVVDRATRCHVGDHAARMAKRHTAIHAASPLSGQVLDHRQLDELAPVAHPGHRIAVRSRLACEFHETCRFPHRRPPRFKPAFSRMFASSLVAPLPGSLRLDRLLLGRLPRHLLQRPLVVHRHHLVELAD